MSHPNGASASNANAESVILQEILASLKTIQRENSQLAAAVDAINGRVNILAGVKQMQDGTATDAFANKETVKNQSSAALDSDRPAPVEASSTQEAPVSSIPDVARRSSTTSKIILTSYPGQAGVDPLPSSWGHKDPSIRGPVVVSRNTSTIRRRNGKHMVTESV